jgi:bifunctional enzyme CysN/CysC
VLAVNKMDLVGYDQAIYDEIVADYRAFAESIGIAAFTAMPISGFKGDNITSRSRQSTPWYDGPTLIGHLESVSVDATRRRRSRSVWPVQWVNRPNLDFRGFAGLIASGKIKPGDAVRIVPSGKTSTVARIVTLGGDPAGSSGGPIGHADSGRRSRLFARRRDRCGRSAAAGGRPVQGDDRLDGGRGSAARPPILAEDRHADGLARPSRRPNTVNVNTLEQLAAKTLELNAIGVANLSTDKPIVFEPYEQSRDLGGFILIDKLTNATVAAGMIHFALRRGENIHWQAIDVTREAHAAQKGQQPRLLWFTGLSGSGKSTIANLVEKKLHALGKHSFLLDGDNVRHGLNRDLGFTDADRVENIRRVGEVAKLMTDAGLIVLTAFISPFRAEREMARSMLPAGEFIEIFIDTPLAEAERRDVKGLYKKARDGQLKNFTGIDSPYEAPDMPEIHIDTTRTSPEDAAEIIVERIVGIWSPEL